MRHPLFLVNYFLDKYIKSRFIFVILPAVITIFPAKMFFNKLAPNKLVLAPFLSPVLATNPTLQKI